jgi:hypothetical protein
MRALTGGAAVAAGKAVSSVFTGITLLIVQLPFHPRAGHWRLRCAIVENLYENKTNNSATSLHL